MAGKKQDYWTVVSTEWGDIGKFDTEEQADRERRKLVAKDPKNVEDYRTLHVRQVTYR